MGRGRGGYTEKKSNYIDSGGRKVTDSGSIFVGERYIEAGYETVFRQRHDEIEQQTYDLTIKSSDDKDFIKNIEVKRTTSPNPSQLAKNIKEGFEQVGNDTVAVYLPNHKNNTSGIDYAKSAFAEAKRKGWIHGTVEVWFSDSKKMSDRLIFN
ncbi:MAG: hypothetical protein IJS61_11595 [Firmicutes bacterium]|nr:hypothetical protein [Bacillota bacterium]